MEKYIVVVLFTAFFMACNNKGKNTAIKPVTEPTPVIQSEMEKPPIITHIKEGQVHFADGSTKAIVGYDDPNMIHFFAVRHCEKAKDGTGNPPLLPEGEARAKRLGKVLDGLPIKRICTTNLTRTIKTGEALIPHVMAAPMETFPPKATLDWLEEVMKNDKGGKFVTVGHQNTIPELINKLTGTSEYKLIPAKEFGNLWIISSSGYGESTVIHGWYE